MDFAAVSGAIGSLGFPIVMCIIMFIKMDKQDEQHKEEMDKITEALTNNTIAITNLTAKIEGSMK